MISTMGLYFVLRGSDQMSRHVRAATSELKKMAHGAEGLEGTLRSLEIQEARMRQSFAKAATYSMAALGIAGGVRSVARAAGEFSHEMKKVQLTLGMTDRGANKLKKIFRSMAGDVEFNSTQLAQGATELARAGFSMKEIMASVPVMADMMTVGQLEASDATSLMIQTLRGYGIETENLRKTMDKMTLLSVTTPASLKFLADGMKYAMRASGAFGISLEETLGTVGLLSPLIMKAGGTGRTFAQFMLKMAAEPSKKLKKFEKENKIIFSAYDKDTKKLKKPLTILADMLEAVKGKSAAVRNQFFKLRLGMRAAAVAGLELGIKYRDLSGVMHKGIKNAQKAMQEDLKRSSGLLKNQSKVLRDEYTVQVERLKAAWDSFKQTIGENVIPVLLRLMDTIKKVMKGFETINKWYGGIVGKVAGTGIAVSPMILGMMSLGKLMQGFMAMNAVASLNSLITGQVTGGGIKGKASEGATKAFRGGLLMKMGNISAALGKIAIAVGLTAAAASWLVGKLEDRWAKKKAAEKEKYTQQKAFRQLATGFATTGKFDIATAQKLKGAHAAGMGLFIEQAEFWKKHRGADIAGPGITAEDYKIFGKEMVETIQRERPKLIEQIGLGKRALIQVAADLLSKDLRKGGWRGVKYRPGPDQAMYEKYSSLVEAHKFQSIQIARNAAIAAHPKLAKRILGYRGAKDVPMFPNDIFSPSSWADFILATPERKAIRNKSLPAYINRTEDTAVSMIMLAALLGPALGGLLSHPSTLPGVTNLIGKRARETHRKAAESELLQNIQSSVDLALSKTPIDMAEYGMGPNGIGGRDWRGELRGTSGGISSSAIEAALNKPVNLTTNITVKIGEESLEAYVEDAVARAGGSFSDASPVNMSTLVPYK